MPVLKTFQILALFTVATVACADEPADPPLRWWKGNIHTHSLWSDGNDFPEMIADWYRRHDYNFLALSDHNILSEVYNGHPGVRHLGDEHHHSVEHLWDVANTHAHDGKVDDDEEEGDEHEHAGHDHSHAIGEVFATVGGLEPKYQLTGEELHVRAVVTSSRQRADPSFKEQYEQAWTQPVGWELEVAAD